MVDRDVVLRKTQAIDHHSRRLRDKLPLDSASLEQDESLRNDVCFDLLQAVQGCIDLAIHVCTHDALGVPDGPASAFAMLVRHGIVDSDRATRLARAASLRNLIVHQYADLDFELLSHAIETGLEDLDELAIMIRDYARRTDHRA